MFSRFLNTRLLTNLLSMAWPTVLYSLLENTVGLVDLYLAGYLGVDEVAAVGFSRQIFLVLMIGTLSITTGTITLISQYYGAGKYDEASSVAYYSLLLSLVSGAIFGTAGVLLAKPGLWLLGARGSVLSGGIIYLRVLMAGVVFLMINFSLNGVFRALGDTKTPLKIVCVICILNVIFSMILIFGWWIIPPCGVMGIALGTILARAVGAAWALWILTDRRRKVRIKKEKGFHWDYIGRILDIGLPSGSSGFFRNGARILFFAVVNATTAGTAAAAGATIGFQLRLLTIMPALAFQVTTAALVGQCIGANNRKEAEAYGWTSIKFFTLLVAAISLLMVVFSKPVVSLFAESTDVIDLGILAIKFIALEQFCNCVSIVVSGALMGAGDTRPSMRYTIWSQWLLMLPLAYVLANYSSMDITGAWLAWGTAPILQVVLTLVRFAGGHWKRIDVGIE